jgi:hypothetical protein
MKKKIILLLSSLLFMSSLQDVQAQSLRESIKQRQTNLRTEIKEKIASNTSVLKLFRSGHVAIENGQLTLIAGTTLTIQKDGKSYTVLTDANTQLRRKFWGKSMLSEFSVGDELNVVGMWQDENHTSITARFVRNLSIQKRFGVFFGTIKTISSSGFTIDTISRGTQTVAVNGATEYTNRRGEKINFSDLAVGQRVRIRGLWDSKSSTITEVTKIKDFSLPVRPVGSPAPSVSP